MPKSQTPTGRPKGQRRPAQRSIPRQRSRKHLPHPHLMARKRILDHLQDTIDRCEDLFNEHGDSCACEACCVTSNFVGTLRAFKMLLEIS